MNGTTTQTPSPSPSPGRTIRPEELRALVERLEQVAPSEQVSVGDVAATLGVSEAQVEEALRDVRTRVIVPPVVEATVPRRRVRGRWRWALGAAATFGVLLIARDIGYRDAQRDFGPGFSSSTFESRNPAEALRQSLPRGFTVVIGDMTFSGKNPGSALSEETLRQRIEGVLEEARGEVPSGQPVLKEIPPQLASKTPKDVVGVHFTPLTSTRTTGNNAPSSEPIYLPWANKELDDVSDSITDDIEEARRVRIATFVNRLYEQFLAAKRSETGNR